MICSPSLVKKTKGNGGIDARVTLLLWNNTLRLGVNMKVGYKLSRATLFIFGSEDLQYLEGANNTRRLPGIGLGRGGERPSTQLCPDKGCSWQGLLVRSGKKLCETTWCDSLGSQLFLYSSCTLKPLRWSYKLTRKVKWSFIPQSGPEGFSESTTPISDRIHSRQRETSLRLNQHIQMTKSRGRKKSDGPAVLHSVLRAKNIFS